MAGQPGTGPGPAASGVADVYQRRPTAGGLQPTIGLPQYCIDHLLPVQRRGGVPPQRHDGEAVLDELTGVSGGRATQIKGYEDTAGDEDGVSDGAIGDFAGGDVVETTECQTEWLEALSPPDRVRWHRR